MSGSASVQRLTASTLRAFSLHQPCIIDGLTAGWRAHARWRPDNLPNLAGSFACMRSYACMSGELVTMRDYMSNVGINNLGSRYIFDATALDDEQLRADYCVPALFARLGDRLAALPARCRPDYRWFLVGHAGTGSPSHVDPMGTCAWNALVHGRKVWRVAPPSPVHQHANFPLEFEQQAGEIVYIPANYWHEVRNATLTVAVTQNFLPLGHTTPSIQELLDELEENKKVSLLNRRECELALAAGECAHVPT